MFNGDSMRICESTHKLTDFVNNKADIWYRKVEILKSTHDLKKLCRVRKQGIW
jgi:glutaredoxin-related protein